MIEISSSSVLDSIVNLTEGGPQGISDLQVHGGIKALANELGTSLRPGHLGLTTEQARRNKQNYGANVLPSREPKSFWEHLKESFEDETLLVLVFSAAVTMAFGFFLSPEDARQADIIQGLAILAAVAVVSGINSFQNWSKDKEFQSLAEVKADRNVFVYRDGIMVEVSIFDLVVGDVAEIKSGDAIPADGLLLRSSNMTVDQSRMTGEAVPVYKDPILTPTGENYNGDSILTSSTLVAEGEGKMLVTSVGIASSIGKLVLAIEEAEPAPTPLQDRLEELAGQIGNLGKAVGLLTFTVLAIFWFFNPVPIVTSASESATDAKSYMDLLQYFIIGISIVVVAVPEGLPLAVTISLAFSMRRMMADKNMVRELKACETMGSATVIASDKTGTLTQNRMTTVSVAVFDLPPCKPNADLKNRLNTGAAQRLLRAIAFNSTAEIDARDTTKPAIFHGNPTEGALLLFTSTALGLSYKKERLHKEEQQAEVSRLAFNKANKYQATVVDEKKLNPLEPSGLVLYVTGAPEIVLAKCSHAATVSGDEVPLCGERLSHYATVVEQMAGQGLRTLALAYRRLPENVDPYDIQGAQTNLTLLGVFGIEDPLRPGVVSAVKKCQEAGIRVMMVTGDHKETAKNIAAQSNIYKKGDRVMEGIEFRSLSEEMRAFVVSPNAQQRLSVLARCSPSDKLLLVHALQANREVVAVTGDGTNDAPALKAADVGLSMGIAGTEVAKEASDIIIMDDNFDSIVKSVIWGRSIKENIRKFLSFQLTINIVALTLTFVSACITGQRSELPLKPVQLLWLNLIMDSFAALALATEPPSEKLLKYAPQGKDEALITPTMVKNMIGHAIFQTFLLIWMTRVPSSVTFLGMKPEDHSNEVHDTVVFNTFVALQVFNLFNCRAVHDEWNILEGFGGSVIAQGILFIICAFQFAIVQFGGDIMQTRPLTVGQWVASISLGALSLPVGMLLKFIPVNLGRTKAPASYSHALSDITINPETVKIKEEIHQASPIHMYKGTPGARVRTGTVKDA